MCTIRERTYSFAALCNRRELSNSIKELSSTANAPAILEIESSLIQLNSFLITER